MNISEALKMRGQTVVTTLFTDLKEGKKVDIDAAEKYVYSLIEEITHQAESKLQLLPAFDLMRYPVVHTVNTTLLSLIMAFKMGIDGLELFEIGLGALLHDIGKINTPDELLWQQEGNSDYERKTISEHPTFGAHWIESQTVLSDEIISIIRNHHERIDGKGYPMGISSREMSRSIHIVSICNYYDHLVMSLPQKGRQEIHDPREACFQLTRQGGKRFSVKYVNLFISLMSPMLMDGPLYRKTALVLLDTREVGAVLRTENFGDTLPEILILTNPAGKKLARPLSVNLKKDGSRKIVKLLRT